MQFTGWNCSVSRKMTSDNDQHLQMTDHEFNVLIFHLCCNLTMACKHRLDEKRECLKNMEVASVCNLALTMFYMWVIEIIVTTKVFDRGFSVCAGCTHSDAWLKDALYDSVDSTWTVYGLLQCWITNKMWAQVDHLRAQGSLTLLYHVSFATW